MIKKIDAWKCTDGSKFFDEEQAKKHQKEVKCEHKNIVKYNHFNAPVCDDCGKRFPGWYCPDSPDHNCHYFTDDNGTVELVTGEFVKPADPDWDKEYETDDECLFCGSPEERK